MTKQDVATALADLGITPAEASLFNVVHYGLTVPPDDLCQRASYPDYSLGRPVTPEETRAALDACVAKGWLQIFDEDALSRLRSEVEAEGLLGPVYGYPRPGGTDFTECGAVLWCRIVARCWTNSWRQRYPFCDVVHERQSHYFPSLDAALKEVAEIQQESTARTVAGPFAIGAWRADWWRSFPEGYRVDIEERRQWQGRSPCGGASVSFEVFDLAFDPSVAAVVLEAHRTTLLEWIVLATHESPRSIRSVRRWVKRNLERWSIAATRDEIQGSIESCFEQGWLRRADEPFLAEVHQQLDADPLPMPLPFDSHGGDYLTLSAAGAKLYRALSAAILGDDWDAQLVVVDTHYWETHLYCASELSAEHLLSEARLPAAPQSIRTTAIGPWCVYWWDRFASGYRTEVVCQR